MKSAHLIKGFVSKAYVCLDQFQLISLIKQKIYAHKLDFCLILFGWNQSKDAGLFTSKGVKASPKCLVPQTASKGIKIQTMINFHAISKLVTASFQTTPFALAMCCLCVDTDAVKCGKTLCTVMIMVPYDHSTPPTDFQKAYISHVWRSPPIYGRWNSITLM